MVGQLGFELDAGWNGRVWDGMGLGRRLKEDDRGKGG